MDKKVIEEITELYFAAREEWKTTKEKDYWQGRKDGLRLTLALLEPNELWKELNSSSPGFQEGEREKYKGMLADIYYNICDLIYSIRHKEKPHPLTVSNIQNWIGVYQVQERHGFVESAPNAINPFK